MNVLRFFISNKSLIFGGLILTVLTTFSCNKEKAPDCLQKAGDRMSLNRVIPAFQSILIEDNIDIIYKSANVDFVTIEGPENLINEIITEVDDLNILSIRNENTCNFVRNLSPDFKITIYSPIQSIINSGVGDITFVDTMLTEFFSLNCKNASGIQNLKLQSDSIYLAIEDGVASLNVSGNCQQLVIFHQGVNKVNAKDLHAESAALISNSINTLEARCDAYLYTRIQSKGDIIYYGEPDLIDLELEGEGSLVFGGG